METTANGDHEDWKENGDNATTNEIAYLKIDPPSPYDVIDIMIAKVAHIRKYKKRYSG
jgi:hypothetical protein